MKFSARTRLQCDFKCIFRLIHVCIRHKPNHMIMKGRAFEAVKLAPRSCCGCRWSEASALRTLTSEISTAPRLGHETSSQATAQARSPHARAEGIYLCMLHHASRAVLPTTCLGSVFEAAAGRAWMRRVHYSAITTKRNASAMAIRSEEPHHDSREEAGSTFVPLFVVL
jgi:hypothetical protein